MKQKLKQLTALILAFAMSMSLLCSSTWAKQLDSTQIENIPVRGEETVSIIANEDEELFDSTDEEFAVEADTSSEDTIEFEESNNSEECNNEDNMIGETVEPVKNELISETDQEVPIETAAAMPTSGSCGKNAKWSYDKSKKSLLSVELEICTITISALNGRVIAILHHGTYIGRQSKKSLLILELPKSESFLLQIATLWNKYHYPKVLLQ